MSIPETQLLKPKPRSTLRTRVLGQLRRATSESFGSGGLRARVLLGATWMGAGTSAEQGIRFARNMVLARLLAPEAFGTMAIVLSAGSIIQTLTDIGVKEAIIQNPRGSEDSYASAAWWLAFGRSMLLYALVFVLAPRIAGFYGNPRLSAMLRVVAIGVILNGALSSKAYVAVRELKFGRWAAINNVGGILGVLFTVILACFVKNVWALVLGNLSEAVARCVLSYALCPYLPLKSWDGTAVRDLLQFSKGICGLTFLNLVFTRADVFVLAKLFPTFQLGLYVMVVSLVQVPTGFIMNFLGQTLLPTLARVQEDRGRMNGILVRTTTLLVVLAMPVLILITLGSRDLLNLVYGRTYSDGARCLIVAAVVAVANILNAQITTVFYAKGVPQMHRRCVAIMAIIMAALIYPFSLWFGLVGGQLAALCSIVAGYVFQIARIRGFTGLNLKTYGEGFVTPVTISMLVAAACLGTRLFLPVNRPVTTIVVYITGCLLAYGLSIATLLWRRQGARALAASQERFSI